ncbi:MAG: hypothetical protein V7647_2600 [Acidobacteriota bacterium]
MRWLTATVAVPVLLVVSATLTARGRADSAALPLMAAVPAHAMEQNPSDFGCPAGQPATPSPGPGFVPSQDCQGWVPADHPSARRKGGAPPAPPVAAAPGSFGCPAGTPPAPSPGPAFVPTQDCQGWVPRDHPLARRATAFDQVISANKDALFEQGKQIFRFDTFGDEAFWGDTLRLHQAIAGAANGGVGPGLSPAQALALGLKVDVNAVPAPVAAALRAGTLDLNNPANTVALLKANAVVGVTAFVNASGSVRSMGIQCAFCHSTVDDSFAPGIGNRLDGWANRELNVGAIIAFAPNLQPLVDLLGVPDPTVRSVLRSWGPGKFDAELILDGKAVNPQQMSHGVVTGTNVPAATLIPPAYGLQGVNLHTWTGWGSIPHWNAFVANLEMHGIGNFFDPRLNDAAQFPIAARNGFGNIVRNPDADLITPKLPALHAYQLSIPAPTPPAGSFDPAAAARGDEIFNGAGRCGSCHREPLFTEPGWNLHAGADIGIDNFQADRAPDHKYRTSPLKGLFAHQKGGFFHDGRFATLLQVVQHYNQTLSLNLTPQQMNDLVEYLKSL